MSPPGIKSNTHLIATSVSKLQKGRVSVRVHVQAQTAQGRTQLVVSTSSVQNVFSPLASISDHLRSLL